MSIQTGFLAGGITRYIAIIHVGAFASEGHIDFVKAMLAQCWISHSVGTREYLKRANLRQLLYRVRVLIDASIEKAHVLTVFTATSSCELTRNKRGQIDIMHYTTSPIVQKNYWVVSCFIINILKQIDQTSLRSGLMLNWSSRRTPSCTRNLHKNVFNFR